MKTIDLKILSGSELYPIERTIPAYEIGAWAVHPSQNGEGWTATDIRSGRAIPAAVVDGLSREEAENVAAHLDVRIGAMPPVACASGASYGDWPYAFEAVIAEVFDEEYGETP